jgi:hypothetical protein
MPRVFISYRREDSGDSARRLYDRLSERFGKDCILMDLQPGSGDRKSVV